MKYIFSIFLIFLLTSCGKPKAVLICGDHVCLNKAEAELYFEENLTLEVKIIDKKVNKNIDLIELNLKNDAKGSREVLISSKNKTNKNLKVLSNEEIVKIKKNIKDKEKKKKIKKIIKEKFSLIKFKSSLLYFLSTQLLPLTECKFICCIYS